MVFKKGHPFCGGIKTQFKKGERGTDAGHWKGGQVIQTGYVYIYKPDYKGPKLQGKYVKRCRLIAEEILGYSLSKEVVIHHINGNKLDDNPNNLHVFSSKKEHDGFEGLKKKPTLSGLLF